ncbi:hypothetical protein [Ochrobactrum teleogrylli]
MGLFCVLAFARPAKERVQKLLLLQEVRVLLARCKSQDRRQIAAQHDHQFIIVRNQFDATDERAQTVSRFRPRGLIVELIVERCYLFVIHFGHVGMKKGRRFLGAFEEGAQFLLARFQLGAPFLHHVHRQRLFEVKIEDPFKFAIDLLDLGLSRLD